MRTGQGQWVKVYQRVRYSVQFTLRNRGTGVGSVVGSITTEHQRIRFSLGFNRIPVIDWDNQRQRVLPTYPRYTEVNREIDRVIEQVHLFFTTGSKTIIDTDGISPLTRLLSHLFPEKDRVPQTINSYGLIPMFNRFLREHSNGGRPLSENTLKNYKVVVNSWKNYQNHVGEEYTIRDFVVSPHKQQSRGEKILESYRRYLIQNGNEGVPCTDNTIVRYLKVFKTFLKWVETETGLSCIRYVHIGKEEVSKHTISLTRDEVRRIEEVQLRPGSKLHHVRNMMILGIYTGLRHSEYLLVNPSLWKEPSQVITSPKTGKLCLVIHREPIRRVLQEYETTGIPSSLGNIQKINKQIKEICVKCGLNREVVRVRTVDGVESHERVPLHETVSTHVFRRTKITLDLNSGRTLRDICIETGQDETIAKRHYDRPNLDELVKSLGIVQVE